MKPVSLHDGSGCLSYSFFPAVDLGVGTNRSGFSALIVGYRAYDGSFLCLGHGTWLWSSTQGDASHAYYLYLYDYGWSIPQDGYGLTNVGFSVRCLKD